MILKRIIDNCKYFQLQGELLEINPCNSICDVPQRTCKHVCSILSVKRPCDIENHYKLNKEDKNNERFN